ncbi:sensor histidine kinase [Hwanghaeella grinnelliae]|uniref:sensor histidine kinase n=1 Tax=Hwanghaeella grinnelliae TaxID=2500179 RepID=UPI00138675C8|nr:ATP-binding protein [Hwanghaeella grinnelliae]
MRQAQLAVVIALGIGTVSALAQILADASNERESLETHASFVLDYASLPAARASYRLDGVGAQELAQSLLSDPALIETTILDDFGDLLAKATRHASMQHGVVTDFLLGSKPIGFERDLFINATTYVGKLKIEIDPIAAAPGFEQRTINSIVSELVKSLLLSVLLLVIYQFMVTKRVTRLAEQVALSGNANDGEVDGDELDQLEQRFRDWTMALKNTARKAEHANNAKTVFLASMSHEMRTPLNAIIGYAEMLEMGIGIDDPSKRAQYLKSIVSSGRHLNKLLADILDFSKIEAGALDFHLEELSPAEVIQENVSLFQDMVGENGLKFETDMTACSTTVIADRSRLRQVLLNLVSNAVKYNKPGGIVRIGCICTDPRLIRLYVEDTGIGIPEDQREVLFSDFVRGRHHQADIPGAGLGLAISKLLTEGMGGIMGCDSKLGDGSSFWIELPAKTSAPSGINTKIPEIRT